MNEYGILVNTKYKAMVDSRFVADLFEKKSSACYGSSPQVDR